MRGKLIVAAGLMIGLLTVAATCQTEPVASNSAQRLSSEETTKASTRSPMTQIRGVALGMEGSEVKDILGKPKVDDPDGFYYVFSDAESLQIRLDADRKVSTASMTYTGSGAKAPDVKDVFGASKVTPGADGRIYELVRYPDAGYWISYSRILLDKGPVTTVTIQKMR